MVYLGLGTNLGNKEQNLRMSVQKIEERIGKIVSLSAFYVTAPWGFASDNSFLNAVVCVETPLRPLEVLKETQAIERELGRTSKSMGGVTHNVNDLLDDLIEQSDRLIGKPVALMSKEDKVRAIHFLNEHGALLVTKSGDKIAKHFGISKYTLYSYLDVKTGGKSND